jgi:hypothetical protein
VHNVTTVTIYVNNRLVATQRDFARLDYTWASAMVVGNRKGDDAESWLGDIGEVSVRAGAFPPQPPLPKLELAALTELYTECGGNGWKLVSRFMLTSFQTRARF